MRAAYESVRTPGWTEAVEAARDLTEAHPDWTVRAVRRHRGAGLEASRDGRMAVGPVGEVVALVEGNPSDTAAAARADGVGVRLG